MTVEKHADLSPCGTYRYSLSRAWDRSKPQMTWIMLNPSTADHEVDDPTIRKCIGFAERNGFGSIMVLNLFALRATDPMALRLDRKPVGGAYQDSVLASCRTSARPEDMVVCAWGRHGRLNNRDSFVLNLIGPYKFCLGTNRDGTPKHPLYVPYTAPLVPFIGKL